jgi:hypothetical protein
MGAAAAAGGAMWLGVSGTVVALFIGAFAVSMGLWIGRIIKKQYIPHQTAWITLVSFATTALPVLPFMMSGTPGDYIPIFISWAGEYGSLLNRTYLINIPLIATLVGAGIVLAAPWMSRKITDLRGETLPYQGVSLTLIILIISATALQLII